jgi:hypothetical protein
VDIFAGYSEITNKVIHRKKTSIVLNHDQETHKYLESCQIPMQARFSAKFAALVSAVRKIAATANNFMS